MTEPSEGTLVELPQPTSHRLIGQGPQRIRSQRNLRRSSLTERVFTPISSSGEKETEKKGEIHPPDEIGLNKKSSNRKGILPKLAIPFPKPKKKSTAHGKLSSFGGEDNLPAMIPVGEKKKENKINNVKEAFLKTLQQKLLAEGLKTICSVDEFNF